MLEKGTNRREKKSIGGLMPTMQAQHASATAGNIHIRPGVRDVATRLWRSFSAQHPAFKIACIYVVFEYNRPHKIWPILDFLPWGQLLILLGCALSFVDRDARSLLQGATYLAAGFALSWILSAASAFNPQLTLASWRLLISWTFVVLYLSRTISTRDRLIVFMAFYYLANLKMAQHGFRSWAERGFGMSAWGVTGSPGWFANSGEFGMEMAMLVPLLGAHLALARARLNRTMFGFSAAFMVMVIGSTVASNSRGALLGLAAAGITFLASSRKRLAALSLLTIAAIAVVAVIPQETLQRFHTAGTDVTSMARLIYWRYGIEAVKEHPFFGVGLANWIPYLSATHPEAFVSSGRVEVIHNTYLEVATELGLFGLSLLLSTIVYIFRLNFSTSRKAAAIGDTWLSRTAAGLNGSLLVFLVTSAFMSIFLYPYIWLLLSMSAGCSAALPRRTFLESKRQGAARQAIRQRTGPLHQVT